MSTSELPSLWRRALGHRSFVLGGVLSLLLVLAATLSLVWTPWSPYEMDIPSKLLPPDAQHWMGTDPFGRDVASLLLVGARNSILVGVIAVSIGLLLGTGLGLLAAARRGWLEELIMRLSDFTFAFPGTWRVKGQSIVTPASQQINMAVHMWIIFGVTKTRRPKDHNVLILKFGF